ncbi:hypothetical protein AMATHDRAFT_195373 [Amanita thiersii Skay4041]|uniref:Thioredoxin domain-containing protein n=1 Tax=Amanita thiersii Skay4041 TaxID=703135 RepID=A0A2A9NIH6_9AGAR|nr:hypothetical protein AMATHDRAFT_195373 [Amanita thiersii Skay4041]
MFSLSWRTQRSFFPVSKRLHYLSCRPSTTGPLKSFSRLQSPLPAPQKRCYSQFAERNKVGVFTPKSAALFVITGIGLLYYFRYEKARMLEEREKERQTRSFGRPNIGGPFTLTAANGSPFTHENLLGKWSLVYFGFTNCPDICPAELDKVTTVMDKIVQTHGQIFLPIFISVDPARDTPAKMKKYLEEFHPSYIGLVGSYDETKAVCKQYRVYFSTPPNADPNDDYLVDHSIFVYLMDPDGKFVNAFGQNVGVDEMTEKISAAIEEWKVEKGKTT